MVRKEQDLTQGPARYSHQRERFFFIKGKITLKVAKEKIFKGLMFL